MQLNQSFESSKQKKAEPPKDDGSHAYFSKLQEDMQCPQGIQSMASIIEKLNRKFLQRIDTGEIDISSGLEKKKN